MLTLKDKDDVDVTYSLFRMEGNKARYIGESHTDVHPDELLISSVNPTSTKSSHGVRRSTVKILDGVVVNDPEEVGTTDNAVARLGLDISLPVGFTSTVTRDVALLNMRSRLVALINDDTTFLSIAATGQLEY